MARGSDEGGDCDKSLSQERYSEITPNKNRLLFKLNFTGKSPAPALDRKRLLCRGTGRIPPLCKNMSQKTGQLVTDSLQRSAFTKGISRIRHLVEFARMLSELWRQTSSDATRMEKSQPTVALLLLNSFHHGSRFPLSGSTYYFTDFPRFIV